MTSLASEAKAKSCRLGISFERRYEVVRSHVREHYWPLKFESFGKIDSPADVGTCLTDEATKSSPPVGGTAGIRGSLSRDLSVFNFIFPSAGFAFLTLTILLSSPRAPSIPSALSSSSIPSHSSSLFSSSSGNASASESNAVFSFFPGRRRFRGFFCDFSMREMRESCFNARLPAFVFADEVWTLGAVVAGREAAATLARIVVRFLPFVGACNTPVVLVRNGTISQGSKGVDEDVVDVEVATAKVVPAASAREQRHTMMIPSVYGEN
ncbi:hypothetical protein KCU64_g10, partial [Aureobasidium melanogenum]